MGRGVLVLSGFSVVMEEKLPGLQFLCSRRSQRIARALHISPLFSSLPKQEDIRSSWAVLNPNPSGRGLLPTMSTGPRPDLAIVGFAGTKAKGFS